MQQLYLLETLQQLEPIQGTSQQVATMQQLYLLETLQQLELIDKQ